MGIMDLFKTPVAPPATPTNPALQGPAAAPSASADTNPTVPNSGNTPPVTVDASGKAVESPMDAFKDLWQTPDASKGSTELFSIDPAKLQQAVSTFDFAKVLKPEDLAAITAGGEGAAKAFASSLNRVTQAAMATSLAQTAKLIQQATDKNNATLEGKIPDLIRSQTVSETNRNENPIFTNPATAPLMKAVEAQMQAKYPTATAAEITAHTKDYLSNFLKLANSPADAAAAVTKAKSEPDWSNFLEGN